MQHPQPTSPVRVFLLVLAVVFAVEASIMLVLSETDRSMRGGLALSLIDSLILVVVLCPVLWILVVRPLRALHAERGALLARTMRIQEEERAKLARDLHDELGQAQTAILLGLRAVSTAQTLEEAHERTESVRQMAVAAVEASRRMARGLSPSVLTDLGLGSAAERVCEDIAEATGIPVIRDIRIGSMRVEADVEIAAYRVLQEALTNAVKHSSAVTIWVSIVIDSGQLLLSVRDDGRGMRSSVPKSKNDASGLGLAGMRERVTLLGGRFAVASGSEGGTTVTASFPLKPRPS